MDDRRPPLDHQEAAQHLVDRNFLQTPKFRELELRTSRLGLRVEIDEFRGRLLAEFKRRGMPFFMFYGMRTHEEQNRLYAMGRSRARGGQSPHNFGCAVDIVHCRRFWNLHPREWAVVGLIGKEVARKANLKIEWGGDWQFYDPAHWEMRDWRSLPPGAVVRSPQGDGPRMWAEMERKLENDDRK